MKLAIRTSSGPYGVGLFSDEGNLIATRQSEGEAFRSASLGDLFGLLLEEIGPADPDIAEILVDLGPGGLSSTRVGVSFANALAFGKGSKIMGVSALELQMYDARRSCSLPVLSMRPAPARKAFWALYLDYAMVARGCCHPQEAVDAQAREQGQFAVVGPLHRLALNEEQVDSVLTIAVDPPSMESFGLASMLHPKSTSSLAFLEPITSIDGL